MLRLKVSVCDSNHLYTSLVYNGSNPNFVCPELLLLFNPQHITRQSKINVCSPQVDIPECAEECQLMDLDPDQESRRRRAHQGNAYEEDDDQPGMNRVQCATG